MKRSVAPPRYTVRSDIAHREIQGRLLLLLPGETRLYTFNETGRLVWQGLLRKRSPAAIAATIARRFDVPLARAERDVRALLADLLRRRIIRRSR